MEHFTGHNEIPSFKKIGREFFNRGSFFEET